MAPLAHHCFLDYLSQLHLVVFAHALDKSSKTLSLIAPPHGSKTLNIARSAKVGGQEENRSLEKLIKKPCSKRMCRDLL